MPHYKDGKEAFIGDFAQGRPSNTPYEIVGRIVSITKGTESCNGTIAFVATGAIAQFEARRMTDDNPFRMCDDAPPVLHRPPHHGYPPVGEPVLLGLARDYCNICDLELVSRPPDAYPCPDVAPAS